MIIKMSDYINHATGGTNSLKEMIFILNGLDFHYAGPTVELETSQKAFKRHHRGSGLYKE